MADKDISIKVHGAKELRLAARAAGKESQRSLREAHKEVAEVITSRSKPPVRSGRLASSVRPQGTQKSAIAAAGGAKTPYAGPIHYGWPARGIRPQPFFYDAMDRHWKEVMDVFEERIMDVAKKLET